MTDWTSYIEQGVREVKLPSGRGTAKIRDVGLLYALAVIGPRLREVAQEIDLKELSEDLKELTAKDLKAMDASSATTRKRGIFALSTFLSAAPDVVEAVLVKACVDPKITLDPAERDPAIGILHIDDLDDLDKVVLTIEALNLSGIWKQRETLARYFRPLLERRSGSGSASAAGKH